MTASPEPVAYPLMVVPFPMPGRRVWLAYHELNVAANGSEEQQKALAITDVSELARPWDPQTCHDPELRHQLWAWLEDVVIWLNHEYAWDVGPLIPGCWPLHPHLVHEIAVVADQRRRTTLALTSDPLEEWHRYCLPSFVDRMRRRLKDHCSDEHKPWPGRGRYTRHVSKQAREDRQNVYAADLNALTTLQNVDESHPGDPRPPRVGATRSSTVNRETGQILDDTDD